MERSFSHVTDKQAGMVDISHKKTTQRYARAMAKVRLHPVIAEKLRAEDCVNDKGPVFHTAIIAGTMAAKNTSQLIPLCHPLPLNNVRVSIELMNDVVVIECQVKTCAATGAEMEALTGASVAALTVYDMVKSVSMEIVIEHISVMEKTGGTHDRTTM